MTDQSREQWEEILDIWENGCHRSWPDMKNAILAREQRIRAEDEPCLNDCVDASVWAKEFMKSFNEQKFIVDEDLMRGWFANAIMAGFDEANRRQSAKGEDKEYFPKDVISGLKGVIAMHLLSDEAVADIKRAVLSEAKGETVSIDRKLAEEYFECYYSDETHERFNDELKRVLSEPSSGVDLLTVSKQLVHAYDTLSKPIEFRVLVDPHFMDCMDRFVKTVRKIEAQAEEGGKC